MFNYKDKEGNEEQVWNVNTMLAKIVPESWTGESFNTPYLSRKQNTLSYTFSRMNYVKELSEKPW